MIKKYYGMTIESVKDFTATSKELLSMVKTMGAEAMEAGKNEIEKSCQINDSVRARKRNGGQLYTSRDGVAFIPISGMLAQEVDFCTAYFGGSMTTYPYIREAIADAEANPLINKIAFMVSSGGGYVDGVDQTAQAIKNAKKPTFSAIENMAASAAYWLASQSDKVVSIAKSALVGSIGVAVSYMDYSEADKKAGYREVTLTSTPATEKRPDVTTEEGKAVIVKELDDLHNVFVGAITSARPKLTAEKINATKGGVLIAEDAKSLGLIDAVIKEAELINYINNTPAGGNNAGLTANITEVKMDLQTFLSQNPAAKAEHDDAIKKAKAGAEEKTAKIVKKVSAVFESDVYSGDPVIRKAATRALSGEISIDVLDYAITAADAQVEKNNSAAAQEETEELGDTPPKVEDGKKNTFAELKKMRGGA